jgi:hypothetical protein
MDKWLAWILAATVGTVALVEHLWLLQHALAAYAYERQHPSCMPFGYVVAVVLGAGITTSIVAAGLLSAYLGVAVIELPERLLWVGAAAVIAPWTAVVLGFPGWLLGPVGCIVAPAIGAAAPYALASLSLRHRDP